VNPSPIEYREDLDAGLLKIAGICLLAAVMASLDTTVVSVAQRTFITEFHTTQAVVAWTMTGNPLALATVIPLTGWAANRFCTRRLLLCPNIIHSSRATAPRVSSTSSPPIAQLGPTGSAGSKSPATHRRSAGFHWTPASR
jgi:MFS family permease